MFEYTFVEIRAFDPVYITVRAGNLLKAKSKASESSELSHDSLRLTSITERDRGH